MSYRVIVSDAPWTFGDRREFRRDNPEKKNRYGMGAKGHYERLYGKGILSTQELIEMGPLIQPLAAPDGYHFQWALNSMLPAALQVMEAWGYCFKTVAMFYNKVNPGNKQDLARKGPQPAGEGSTFYGTGRYTFSCLEQLLLGVRGRPWHNNKGCFNRPVQELLVAHEQDFEGEQGLWEDLEGFSSPVHRITQPRGYYDSFDEKTGIFKENYGVIPSRKPAVFQDQLYNWLHPYCGDGQFLEIFATEKKPGWDSAGCAVSNGMDILDELRHRKVLLDMRKEFLCAGV